MTIDNIIDRVHKLLDQEPEDDFDGYYYKALNDVIDLLCEIRDKESIKEITVSTSEYAGNDLIRVEDILKIIVNNRISPTDY